MPVRYNSPSIPLLDDEAPARKNKMNMNFRKLDLLKEEVFPISGKAWAQNIFKEYYPNEDSKKFCAYCLYYDEKRPKIISGPHFYGIHEFDHELISNLINDAENFKKFIKLFGPHTFKDLLFLLDIYNVFQQDWFHNFEYLNAQGTLRNVFLDFGIFLEHRIQIAQKNHPSSKMRKILDELLADSKGLLIWEHQMNLILGLFVSNHNKIQELKKGFNAKLPETLKKLKNTRIDSEISLLDFITGSLIFPYTCVFLPNLKGASELYGILK